MLAPRIPDNEFQRMDALRALGVMYTPAEERFDRITRLASRVLGMPIALVSLVARDVQWFKSVQGIHASETSRDVSFCGHAIVGDDALIVEDALDDPRFADNPLVSGDPNIRFYAGQPLRAQDGNRVGTLCVIDRAPRTFTSEQQEILRDLAGIVESELQHQRLGEAQVKLIKEREELQRKAMVDGLTHVWNRTAMMDLLDAEIGRARRGSPVCVCMVDADHFKQVNDTYGHLAGDTVLVEIASRIRRAGREFDAVGRYGGEEFVVILSNCNLAAARTAGARMLKLVAHDPVNTGSGPVRVTISIGIATYDPDHTTAEQIVGAADAALYRAKSNGRNRVEI